MRRAGTLVLLLLFAHSGSAGAPPSVGGEARLEVLQRALEQIDEGYISRERLEPSVLFVGALQGLERGTGEVVVDAPTADGKVAVRVGSERRTFEAPAADGDELVERLRSVFHFLAASSLRTDPRVLERHALRGLLAALDPETELVVPGEGAVDEDGDSIAGVGVVFARRAGAIRVLQTFSGSPAARAGIRAGDTLVAVDERPVGGLTAAQAASMLGGPKGTAVTLELAREGTSGTRSVLLIRGAVPTFEVEPLDGGVLYVRLESFGPGTERQVRQALIDAKRKEMSLAGIIVDLRANGGGALGEVVGLAGLFTDEPVCRTVGRDGTSVEATPSRSTADVRSPVVVLVDHDTAAGGELFAAALQEADRAIVFGARTAGEGLIKMPFALPDGSFFTMPTGRVERASGRPIEGAGVIPDVEVIPVRIDAGAFQFGARQWRRAVPRVESSPSGQPLVRLRVLRKVEDPWMGPADAEARLAAEFLRKAGNRSRKRMTEAVRSELTGTAEVRDSELVEAFRAHGIDWKAGGMGSAPKLVVRAEADGPLTVDRRAKILVTVENRGTSAAARIHTRTLSDDVTLNGLDLPFGLLKPGESRTRTLEVSPHASALEGAVEISVRAHQDGGPSLAEVRIPVRIDMPAPAAVELSWRVEEEGNGDGFLGFDERGALVVRVANGGPGAMLPVAILQPLTSTDIVTTPNFLGWKRLPAGGTAEGRYSLWRRTLAGGRPNGGDGGAAFVLGLRDGQRDSTVRVPLLLGPGVVADSKRPADTTTHVPSIDVRPADGHFGVRKAMVRLEGFASAPGGVKDLWAFVNGDKVHYRAVDDAKAERAAVAFDAPLTPGLNEVEIVARAKDGTERTRYFGVVRIEE